MSTFDWERVGPTIKMGLALAGGLYVTGFFVVLVHLSKYGLYPTDIMKTQYIVVGVIALSPIVSAHITGRFWNKFASYDLSVKLPRLHWVWKLLIGVVSIIVFVTVGLILAAISVYLPLLFLWLLGYISLGIAFQHVVLLGVFIFFGVALLEKLGLDWTKTVKKFLCMETPTSGEASSIITVESKSKSILNDKSASISFFNSIGGPVLFLFYLYVFAYNIYPAISVGLGGGEIVSVKLIATASFRKEFNKYLVDGKVMELDELYKVTSTAQSLFFVDRPESRSLIEIPRSHILACIYLENGRTQVVDVLSKINLLYDNIFGDDSLEVTDTLPVDSLPEDTTVVTDLNEQPSGESPDSP